MTYSRLCLNTGDVNIKFVCRETGALRTDGTLGRRTARIAARTATAGCSSPVVASVARCIEPRERCSDARRFDRIRLGSCIPAERLAWRPAPLRTPGRTREGKLAAPRTGMQVDAA